MSLLQIGRYVLCDKIASGGMASVHLGRLEGSSGFSRVVAIKRLHSTFADDPAFVEMLLDEARVASRIRHPNVVSVIDVVTTGNELLLVMEYVEGLPLAALVRSDRDPAPAPPAIAASIMVGALYGLHAAHEAPAEDGTPLGIVHRDVSPQNILVGTDGLARVVDFGIAKAAGRLQATGEGVLKGKIPYMAPEQLRALEIDRRVDVYAATVVLWELLTGFRLFGKENQAGAIYEVLEARVPRVSEVVLVPAALDDVVARGLDRDPDRRPASARELAMEIERALRPAPAGEVADWVRARGASVLSARASLVSAIERANPRATTGEHLRTTVSGAPPTPAANTLPSDQGVGLTHTAPAFTATDPPPSIERKPNRTRAALAIFALLVIGLAFAVVVRRPPSAPSVASSPAGGPSPAPPSASAASAASSAPAPASASSDLLPLEPPEEPASPPIARPTAQPTATAHRPTKPNVAKPAAKPKADCDPPYSYNAQGRKVYKRECL
jgi:serine/threonine-protein kinase